VCGCVSACDGVPHRTPTDRLVLEYCTGYSSRESTSTVPYQYLRSTMDRPIRRFFFPGSGTCPLSYCAVVCGRLGIGEGVLWIGF